MEEVVARLAKALKDMCDMVEAATVAELYTWDDFIPEARKGYELLRELGLM